MKAPSKVWEIWRAVDGTESGCFLATACSDVQYHLLTHTVDDVPMEFVASFAERSTRVAFDTVANIMFGDDE